MVMARAMVEGEGEGEGDGEGDEAEGYGFRALAFRLWLSGSGSRASVWARADLHADQEPRWRGRLARHDLCTCGEVGARERVSEER